MDTDHNGSLPLESSTYLFVVKLSSLIVAGSIIKSVVVVLLFYSAALA